MFASRISPISRGVTRFLVALMTLLTSLLSASSASVRAAPAYTEIGGPIISDTTWTLMNSPYIVTTNVQVTAGVTLTVEAGVVVKFNQDTLLQVDGTLVARGTDGNPIAFTSNQASPAKGDWKNIAFTDSSVDATFDAAGNYTGGSILEYCIVEYGGNGVGGTIQTDCASPLIDHCTVRNNDSRGILAVGTDSTRVVIRNNIVSGNSMQNQAGGGIFAGYGTVTGNTVSGNSAGCGGGIATGSGTVASNTVSENSADYGGGICVRYGSTAVGNIASSNSATNGGGGIYVYYDSTAVGNIVSGNSAAGGGGIDVSNTSTATDNTVTGNSARYGGGIYAVDSAVIGNMVSKNTARDGGGIHALYTAIISNTVTANNLSPSVLT